jgi:hypothetical protein
MKIFKFLGRLICYKTQRQETISPRQPTPHPRQPTPPIYIPKFKKELQFKKLDTFIVKNGFYSKKINFEEDIISILTDYVKEPGVVKIISEYTCRNYICVFCNILYPENEIIFYNRGKNNIITECIYCS